MSRNEKNVPKRRFKEFENAGEWEQCKVGELTNVTSAARVHKEEWASSGIPFFRSSDVVSAYKGTENEKAFISYELFEKLSRVSGKLGKDDILVTGGGSIGIPYIVPNNEPLYSKDADLIWIKSSKKFNSQYLHTFFTTSCFRNYVSSISHIGTIAHYTIEQVKDTPIYMPSPAEQEKVGVFFKGLDKLITFHQRKLEKMKALKKAYLTELFPAEGERKPKLRFAGFTDEWEQRDVTEIGKIYIGLVTTMTKHYTDCGTLLIRNSDIKDNRFEFGDNPIYLEKSFAEANSSRKHQIGDVITVHTGDVGTSAVITEKEENTIGFATIVTRPNKQIIDSYYFSTFLNTDKHKKWAVSISTGDGRTNYNLGDYFKLVVPVPSLEEQKKIADFIERLNNLITLHQRELEKLQNIKKAYLNEMFI